jgi:hypothetical protein
MLTDSVRAKIDEQIERTIHLIGLLPEHAGASPVGELLGHLLDCMAGFCAVLYRAHPEELAHFESLRSLPVNQVCTPEAACRGIATYRAHIHQGFDLLSDSDLGVRLQTIFVPEGETVLTLLLGNLEHLINHKHQLFTYLKLMGVAVGTPDLYQFRG